jgi:hypothetical protein
MSEVASQQFESALSEGVGRLGDLGHDLLAAIPMPERALAARLTVATRHRLPAGAWSPDDTASGGSAGHPAVLLHGVIVRDVVFGGRASGHLVGPGDILYPWRDADATLPVHSLWTCGPDGAVIAALDQRFERVARKWPGVALAVQERLTQQLEESTLRTAIVSLPRAEQRVLALMWQLADRWGVVRPEGVVVRLQLTHELIGRLIGARRPTVSLALHALAEEGILERRDADSWRLAHDSSLMIERHMGTDGVPIVSSK